MRTYRSISYLPDQPELEKKPKLVIPAITAKTKLVNLKEASRLLKEEKGMSLSVFTMQKYCRTQKWIEGYHWVKPGKEYLINMEAVYVFLLQKKLYG